VFIPSRHIGYYGVDTSGKKIEREARDFHARVVQHECDHLDGVLYPMRMTDLSSFGFVEEMEKQNQNRLMRK
jgi:peptide deformylase